MSVVLDRGVGVEVFVADVGIVEVVECGEAESSLAEGPRLQVVLGKGSVVDKEGRGVFVAMGRGVVEPCLFLNECAQQAALYVESFPLERGGDGYHLGVSRGVDKVVEVGIEVVPLQVGRERDLPPREKMQ